MAGTFPTTRNPARIVPKSKHPTIKSYSETGARQARKLIGQWFEFELIYQNLTQSEHADITGFLEEQQNQDIFDLDLFGTGYPDNLGAWTNSGSGIAVNGAHTNGDTTIALKNFAINTTDQIKRGDFLKFENHNKIYRATADADSDASGFLTVNVKPGLVSSVADLTNVRYNSPFLLVKVAHDDDIEWPMISGYFSTFTVLLREAL